MEFNLVGKMAHYAVAADAPDAPEHDPEEGESGVVLQQPMQVHFFGTPSGLTWCGESHSIFGPPDFAGMGDDPEEWDWCEQCLAIGQKQGFFVEPEVEEPEVEEVQETE